MLRNSPKIYCGSKSPKKASKYVKPLALQNGNLGFSNFLDFDRKIFKKNFFFENLSKTQKFFEFSETGIYVMKTSICYAHAKFSSNASVFGDRIAKTNAKTT